MYEILTKIIIAAALLKLGLSMKDASECSRACVDKLQRASHKILRVD